jgi:ATP-dependent helicase/DNAse subunit B
MMRSGIRNLISRLLSPFSRKRRTRSKNLITDSPSPYVIQNLSLDYMEKLLRLPTDRSEDDGTRWARYRAVLLDKMQYEVTETRKKDELRQRRLQVTRDKRDIVWKKVDEIMEASALRELPSMVGISPRKWPSCS